MNEDPVFHDCPESCQQALSTTDSASVSHSNGRWRESPSRRFYLLLGPLVALLLATPTNAQVPCENDPDQEVPNCSFETGVTGWTLAEGDSLTSSTTAREGSFAAAVDAGPPGGAFPAALVSACFPATFGPSYGFGVYLRLASGTVDACGAFLVSFSDGSCSSSTGAQVSAVSVPDSADWLLVSGMATLTGTHAQLAVECSSGSSDYVLLVDDAFAGPDLTTPVTLQSFSVN